MYFHVQKINDEKRYVLAKKNVREWAAAGMRLRVGRTTTASHKWPEHDPIVLFKQTESKQNRRPFEVVRWSWPKANSNARPHLVRVHPFGVERMNSAAQRAAPNGQMFRFRSFLTHSWSKLASSLG